MSQWIKVARTIHSDPKVARLAVRLGVTVNEAVGSLIGILVQMPDHALDGNLGDIEPLLLARWADWRGEPQTFADTFGELFLTGGVWESWAEHNGRDLQQLADDAERKREFRRTRRRTSTGQVPDASGQNGRTVHGQAPDAAADVRRTIRDDTRRYDTREEEAAAAAGDAGRNVERLREVIRKAEAENRPVHAILARMRATKAGKEEPTAAILLAELDGANGRAPVTLAVLNRALEELAAHPTAEFSARSLAGFIRGVLSAPPDAPPAAPVARRFPSAQERRDAAIAEGIRGFLETDTRGAA